MESLLPVGREETILEVLVWVCALLLSLCLSISLPNGTPVLYHLTLQWFYVGNYVSYLLGFFEYSLCDMFQKPYEVI